jgi:hypothetical protein
VADTGTAQFGPMRLQDGDDTLNQVGPIRHACRVRERQHLYLNIFLATRH